MIYGISNDYLYAVTHLRATFSKGINSFTAEGTGFFINKDGEYYLITNKHVVDIEYNDPGNRYTGYKLSTLNCDARRFDTVKNKSVTQEYEIVNFDIKMALEPFDDIVCLYNVKVRGTVDLSPVTIPFSMLADSDFIQHKLTACDRIALIGFPAGVWDVKNNLPILRSGVISSDPRLDYYNRNTYNGHVIGYEAFSTGGASGSPVFALQKGYDIGGDNKAPDDFYRETKLIGINAQSVHIGNENQHMSLMYKSDQIIPLIIEAEKEIAAKAQATP